LGQRALGGIDVTGQPGSSKEENTKEKLRIIRIWEVRNAKNEDEPWRGQEV
jgi:hypothetical protein